MPRNYDSSFGCCYTSASDGHVSRILRLPPICSVPASEKGAYELLVLALAASATASLNEGIRSGSTKFTRMGSRHENTTSCLMMIVVTDYIWS